MSFLDCAYTNNHGRGEWAVCYNIFLGLLSFLLLISQLSPLLWSHCKWCIPLLLLELDSSHWSAKQYTESPEHTNKLFPDQLIVAHFDNSRGHFECFVFFLFAFCTTCTQEHMGSHRCGAVLFQPRSRDYSKGCLHHTRHKRWHPKVRNAAPLSRCSLYETDNLFQEGSSMIKVCKTNTIGKGSKWVLFCPEELSVKQNHMFLAARATALGLYNHVKCATHKTTLN